MSFCGSVTVNEMPIESFSLTLISPAIAPNKGTSLTSEILTVIGVEAL